MHAKLIGVVALLSLSLLFALQNASAVNIRFLFWSVSCPLALLILILLAVGLVSGWVLGAWPVHGGKKGA